MGLAGVGFLSGVGHLVWIFFVVTFVIVFFWCIMRFVREPGLRWGKPLYTPRSDPAI